MEPTDLTIEILKDIRDEARLTRGEVRQTNERLERLERRHTESERRHTESEIRLATEVVGVAGAVRELRDLLRDDLALRARVDDHERRLLAVERRPG
jgi:DNA-directed RNA polymerase sigma subunit (sigma70/sigma32)